MRRHLDQLRPNDLNAELFAESLSADSIRLLAADMEKNGQASPVLATKAGIIIDGERRWRAAQLLKWEMMEVTTIKVGTKRDVLARVIGSVTAARHMTLREQVKVYKAYRVQLQREHGRPVGRPVGGAPQQYMSREQIKLGAMKLAHIPFRSTELMDQLVAIFERASPGVQERVNAYDLSISRAYETIQNPKPEPDPAQADAAADAEKPVAARSRSHIQEVLNTLGELAAGPEGPPLDPTVQAEQDARIKAAAFPSASDRVVAEILAKDPVFVPADEAQIEKRLEGLPEPPAPRKTKPQAAFDTAVEALWVLESPEGAVLRLLTALETNLEKLKRHDADRARLCVREHVKPVIVRIANACAKVRV